MDKIRLMIVEDDAVWMKCISELVQKETDIIVVSQAFTKDEALQIDSSDVDVVLMDLTLSEGEELGGLHLSRELNEKGFEKIIMLTSWDEPEVILESFDIGATNYINKTSYKDIPKAIREAYSDKVSFNADVSSLLINELRLERKASVLTPAEREVFKLKEKGLSRAQIAEKLFKSVETIKKQLKTIKEKIK
ncbi:response regulator transcription factor [Bacillus subtilis]|jgi:DNA-binding NarL/FixJ family response regulator|uniref:Response regulator transcription factor n=1 Tax=Bacillus subtilis TaxID=1423 RepID=A0A8I2B8R6_BACIU|nr:MULTISPECIES: response regulator transcription factor [Bacillus subtilis group]ARV45906.1 LuxR family transcriptional regulator [Bacillus subtilis]MBO3794055.1 response regulator transcription factor [Bacillus subtilis]MCY8238509.1 response regulator transcription factor [Bacillus inaquosorum]MDF4199630.1 response regulator transcription factor [Bacillus subtilis]MDF4216508.1 response regulator transcription factor [Bacillus subtilis]